MFNQNLTQKWIDILYFFYPFQSRVFYTRYRSDDNRVTPEVKSVFQHVTNLHATKTGRKKKLFLTEMKKKLLQISIES
jgi:hypothetical protein